MSGSSKSQNKLLTEQDMKRIVDGSYVGTDYFYIPLFYSLVDTEFGTIQYPEYTNKKVSDTLWFTLRYFEQDDPDSLIAYASKVNAGFALEDAIRYDLTLDFNYPEEAPLYICVNDTYLIFDTSDAIQPYDTAMTKDGEELSRLIVMVQVDKFETDNITPIGMKPFWQFEGDDFMNLAYIYYLGLSQGYMIIPNDTNTMSGLVSKNALKIAAKFPENSPYRLKNPA